MIYMFLSNNPSLGDINSLNLPCEILRFPHPCPSFFRLLSSLVVPKSHSMSWPILVEYEVLHVILFDSKAIFVVHHPQFALNIP